MKVWAAGVLVVGVFLPALAQSTRADADVLRSRAEAMRQSAAQTRVQEEKACEARFLVNSCRDDAAERYLAAMKAAREVEGQAIAIERALRVRASAPQPVVPKPAAAPGPARQAPRQSVPTTQPMPTSLPAVRKAQPTADPLSPVSREREAAQQRAERSGHEREAAERARHAREDAARYQQRQAEAAARRARRGDASQAGASGPATGKLAP